MAQLTTSIDDKLALHRTIIFDCETLACVPNRNELRDSNYHYCKGWGDKRGMGISVIGVYDFVEKDFLVFMADNLSEFATLVATRNIICGFNNERFDNPLCEAHGVSIPDGKSYDLHKEIVKKVPPGQRSGYKLDNLLKANKLHVKGGEGAEAPKLAQRGEWGKLLNYVIRDIKCTLLLMRAVCNKCVISPKTSSYIENIDLPWEVVKDSDKGGLF